MSRPISRSNWYSLSALSFSMLLASFAQADFLNQEYFEASGGDATSEATVTATLKAGYSAAHAYSNEVQFLSVGTLGQSFFGFYDCTATWIGNDAARGKTYLLTAAHCIESDPVVLQGSISTSFTDWNGNNTILSGTYHLPPERLENSCGGGACSDIAILELDGQIHIQDSEGHPVPAPLIYDGDREAGFENSFVGYGLWGIGNHGMPGGLFPPSGRAGSTNVIDGFMESNKAIRTDFDAPGTDNARIAESALAPGDSGSAWWQKHLGKWTIIATTNGGSGSAYGAVSTGARASQYADWIRAIFPDVSFWSENILVGDINLDGVLDADLGGDDDYTAFLNDWQSKNGPSDGVLSDLNEDHVVDMADWTIFSDAVFAHSGVRINPDALTNSVSTTERRPTLGLLTIVLLALVLIWFG